MLFNLAAAIQLEPEKLASTIREDSVTIRQTIAANAGLSVIREIREPLKQEFLDSAKVAANDDGLPAFHYKGENLTFWMMPTVSADAIRLKHGDSEWIESKLRRVPHDKRQSLSDEYSQRYKAVYDAETDENKKANKAAFAANSWLLRVTK
jgi:predicted amino acid dehydrogenase